MDCKACGEVIPEDSEFCARCGASASGAAEEPPAGEAEEPASCPRCGESIPMDARFCPRCGEALSVGPDFVFSASEESVALAAEREAAAVLPYVHWFLTIVYTIITLGLYQPAWFLRRRAGLGILNQRLRISSGAMWFCLIYLALSFFINLGAGVLDVIAANSGAIRGVEGLVVIGGAVSAADFVLSSVAYILLLVQSFRVRRILLDHFVSVGKEIKVGGVCTFLFTIVYLQHKMNRGIIEPYVEN